MKYSQIWIKIMQKNTKRSEKLNFGALIPGVGDTTEYDGLVIISIFSTAVCSLNGKNMGP